MLASVAWRQKSWINIDNGLAGCDAKTFVGICSFFWKRKEEQKDVENKT